MIRKKIVQSLPKGVINDVQIVVQEEGNNYNFVSSACTPCNQIFYHYTYGLATQ